jgi:soluble lytic murein transglycosylase
MSVSMSKRSSVESSARRRPVGAIAAGGLLAALMAGLVAWPGAAGASRALAATTAMSADSAADLARVPRPRPENVAVVEDVAATGSLPLPRRRPEVASIAPAPDLAADYHGFEPDVTFAAALDALDAGDYSRARVLARAHEDPLAAELVEWFVARQADSGQSAKSIIDLYSRHPDWPDGDRLRLRAEQAFLLADPADAAVLAFFSQTPPRTFGGRLALAAAMRDSSREEEANELVRRVWREESLSEGQEKTLLADFGAALRQEDHLYRFRRLALRAETAEAVSAARFLADGHAALARAVGAAVRRRADAQALLRESPPELADDPLHVFAEARLLRRAEKPAEAGRLILASSADAATAGDGDVWLEERLDLSRALIDAGLPELAYAIVAGHHASGEAERTEAAFQAGWYALRFLNDPQLARPHFEELLSLATLTRTRGRAHYWLARMHDAAGKDELAKAAYAEAARFGGTFYGQLARQALGLRTTGLERAPQPSALDRIRFSERDGVKAIRLLVAAGHGDKAFPFIRELGRTVETPGEAALLTALARRIGQPRAGMIAAALAEQRGLDVASLTAPFIGVPAGLPLPERVDRALVFAVARQESAFNLAATSHAGARGLMQLMPGTAKETARNAQMPFSLQRLTADPLYNATLGAQHLAELLDRVRRSYVLTFVAYNAGPGRARQWVDAHGDPRSGAVDAVDWIERIPFDETRGYVQKVMENLQVYRSRTGHPLSISQDLVRGGAES